MTVIQASLTPKIEGSDGGISVNDCGTGTITSSDSIPSPIQRIASNSSFDITDPQESFMATISALIASLNFFASSPQLLAKNHDFIKNLHELIKLFTTVFIKNINIVELVDIFEFQVDGKVISEHLLTAYINFVSVSADEVVLKSLLVLISSNLNNSGSQTRYFHLFLTEKLSSDHLSSLFDALMEISCIFTYKTVGFIGSVPIISEKSRLASQILVSLLLNSQSDIFPVLKRTDNLKSFALFIKFQSQIFQNSHLNLNDLTILTILSNSFINFCPNYRRFLLSKLDNEELVSSLLLC